MERHSNTLLALVGFCLGVLGMLGSARAWPLGVVLGLPLGLTFGLAIGLAIIFARHSAAQRPLSRVWRGPLGGLLGGLLGLSLGLGWCSYTIETQLQRHLPAALEKQDVVVQGRVLGVPLVGEHYTRFDFWVDSLRFNGRAYPSPGKVRLKHYRAKVPYAAAERWQLRVRLKRARGYQNPASAFDYETYLFAHKISATGYVRAGPADNRRLATASWLGAVSVVRQRAAEFIRATLWQQPTAALLSALSVGIRDGMQAQQWQVLQDTGTIHLMAISGLHIGLVAGLVGWVVARIWRLTPRGLQSLPAPTLGLVAALAAAAGYALLAGLSIPTRRALCMLVVVGLALLLQRRRRVLALLVQVMAVVLALDPLAPLQRGFWLSFGAVAALCVLARTTSVVGSGRARLLGWCKAWSLAQLALLLGMAPLLLGMFGRISLVAPLANLVAVPLVGLLVVPLGLVGLVLWASGLEGLAALCYQGAAYLLRLLWWLLTWLAQAPWGVWQQFQPPWGAIVVATFGLLLLFCRAVLPSSWLGAVALLPLVVLPSAQLSSGEFRYTLLEVGHGLASVVQTQTHVMVFDSGPKFPSGLDMGKSVVLPYLRSLPITAATGQVDLMVISHGDNDHIGGHAALLQGVKVGAILTSVPQAIPTARRCQRGQTWRWDGVDFAVLWPPRRGGWSGNDASCVIRISSAYGSLLLTGDIEKPAEAELLRLSGQHLQSDALQVPHQGSRTSSTAEFLNAVQPRMALVSTGYLNRYHHPHADVRRRYRARNIAWYNTAYDGAITLSFDSTGIKAQAQRRQNQLRWIDQRFE